MAAIPEWLQILPDSRVPQVDYRPEIDLLTQFQEWAQENGWRVTDGSNLPIDLRQRTDVVLEWAEQNQRIRLAVLRKSRNGTGRIRLDASNLKTLELVHPHKQAHWRVEAGGIRVEDDLLNRGWEWLIRLMFQA